MKARLAGLLAVLLALPGLPAFAQSPTSETYNVRATPLDELSRDLLLETGYVIRDDGKIWDKIADSAVRLDEMSYLLSRLAGARRLKALLEINLILNRSEGEKKFTAEEREAVRKILRKNWSVFGVGTRKDFRSYFSVQELTEELDKVPVRFDRGSAMVMRDPDPTTAPVTPMSVAAVSVTAPPPAETYAPVPLPAPETRPVAAAGPGGTPGEAPRQFVPRNVLTPFLPPLSLRRPSPFAPRAKPVPVAAVAESAPAYQTAPQAYAPAPVPLPAPSAAAPQAPAPVTSLIPGLGALPAPSPMVYAAPPTPVTSVPPAPAAPAAAQVGQTVAQAPPAPPPALTPQAPPSVTAAGPAAPNMPARAPAAAPAAPVPMPPSNSLFGAALPSMPPPASKPGELGVLQAWIPPGAVAAPAPPSASPQAHPPVIGAQPAAPAAAPAVVVAAPPVAVVPPAPVVRAPADATAADYDAFIVAGPYGRESQALLKMLAEKAPDFCRAILRRTVVRGAPLIVVDGSRAGTDRRAGFAPYDAGHPGVTIALSAGPVLVERKTGMFAKTVIALPEDPRAWVELGVAAPAVDAFKKGAAPSSQENGPWGATAVYPDKSRRGSYSAQEQAGELLERLLILGLEREGFASSTYAARAWARAARLLFSARVADDYGNDAFLDPDRRRELRDFIERGDESDDLMVAAWSSSRGNVLDPRRGGPESQAVYERQAQDSCTRSLLADHLAEAARNLAARARTIEALNDSGLLSAADARSAAEKIAAEESAARKSLLASPPVCDGRFGADENGLHRSAALLAEVSRAERAFHERKSKGTNE